MEAREPMEAAGIDPAQDFNQSRSARRRLPDNGSSGTDVHGGLSVARGSRGGAVDGEAKRLNRRN
jgi:hypothetical protein